MDVRRYNREAWDHEVELGNPWTVPVTAEAVAAARRGEWQVVLTPVKPAPRAWFGDVRGMDVLCLASGGGQQGPILAAAGANVTVFDNSPAQLGQDRLVAQRDGLDIRLVEGDMRDLSALGDARFDLVFHPVSNLFVPDVRPVWREAFRVLKPGGHLLAGFVNPVNFLLDRDLAEQDVLQLRYALPYSDLESLSPQELKRFRDTGEPLEWGHSLEDQIGGQVEAGFQIVGFYEDYWGEPDRGMDRHMPSFIATRARRP